MYRLKIIIYLGVGTMLFGYLGYAMRKTYKYRVGKFKGYNIRKYEKRATGIFLLSLALMFAVYYFDKPTFWVSSIGLGVIGVSVIFRVANIFESIVEEGFDQLLKAILNAIFS